MENNLCRIQELDSKIFNFRVANTCGTIINANKMNQINEWCDLHEIEVLCALVDMSDYETTQLVAKSGFDFVGLRVELENKDIRNNYPLKIIPAKWKYLDGVRPAVDKDKEAIKKIASDINTDSRFFFDPCFISKAPTLYEAWIENSFNGYDDAIFVSEIHNEIAGYITIKADNNRGEIDLLGIDRKYQGIGMSYALICKSFEWFINKGLETVIISTQGRNIKAINLYEKAGFLTKSILGWYHQIRQTRND